jgi:hypothetical protein
LDGAALHPGYFVSRRRKENISNRRRGKNPHRSKSRRSGVRALRHLLGPALHF